MRIFKKSVSLLLSLLIVISLFSAVPFTLSAESAAVYFIDANGQRHDTGDFWSAWNNAINNRGSFGLLRDWVENRRRIVPANCTLTIELNGNIISRGMSKKGWEKDGEVICVSENTTLNIYGGTKAEPSLYSGKDHILYGYTTIRNEEFDYTPVHNAGGAIHGGNSTYGSGGIQVDNDNNTIESCTVYGNRADEYGGGIDVDNDCDINISGSLIVRGNTSGDNGNDNLYLHESITAASYINPSLTDGADVHIRPSSSHKDKISVAGSFRDDQYSCDDPSKHIEWLSDYSKRALYVVDGEKPAKTVSTFTPDAGRRTQSVAGGYTADSVNYELLKGVFEYPAFDDAAVDLEGIFYYSDGYFMGDPDKYNEHLATMSFCLASAAGYSNKRGTKDDDSYLNESNNFRQLMSDIGCKDEDIFVNDFNLIKPTADTIGVGIASKALPDGNTLVVVGVRGMGYEAEWVSNMTLGTTGEAQGWSTASKQVMAELKAYLERKGIDDTSTSTKFWIAGYSRAGATANLTAKRVIDTYDNSGAHTFADPIDPENTGVQTITAYGTINTDQYDAAGIALTAAVTVHAAEKAAAPKASLASGMYVGVKAIELSAEEDAAIYYAIVETSAFTDTNNVSTSSVFSSGADRTYIKYTEPIVLSKYGRDLYIFAYAEKEGVLNSSEISYRYHLTKPVVQKLDEKAPMIAENGTDYIYSSETECTPTILASEAMDAVTDNLIFDGKREKIFVGHSISLNGDIGVNYYLNLSDEAAADMTVSFARMVEGNRKTASSGLKKDLKTGLYKSTCPIAVAEMTYDITASITAGGFTCTDSFSAVRYADVILSEDYRDSYTDTGAKSYDNLRALILSMLDYGAMAQIKFNRNVGDLADKKLVKDDQSSLYYYVPAEVDAESINTGASVMSEGLPNGLAYSGTTIVYLTQTAMRHYYTGDLGGAAVTFNDVPVTAVARDDQFYFELKDIAAADLDTLYTLKIGEAEYKYSALDYVKACLTSETISPEMKDLARATYRYNMAANAYFD